MVEHYEAGRLTPGDSQELTNEVFHVADLPGGRLGEAVGLLTRGFHTNPNLVNLLPEEGVRSHALPRMLAAGLRDALRFGHVYAATREVRGPNGDALAGVAIWLPPGRSRSQRGDGFALYLTWPACWPPHARRVGSSGTRPTWRGRTPPSRTGTGKWSASIRRRGGSVSARGCSGRSWLSPTRLGNAATWKP